LKVAVSDEVSVQTVDRASLSDGWEFKQTITQNIGDNWLASTPTALLAIPSAPSPESTNYLLNGLHPDAHKIKIEWCRWITYDDRLLGIREKS
jgi:RES domain-containing protein